MFRFTIRDLLWLTVVVGLSTGWWIDRVTERHGNFDVCEWAHLCEEGKMLRFVWRPDGHNRVEYPMKP
jgi:hypothetical protein